jgi:hypothetical protein
MKKTIVLDPVAFTRNKRAIYDAPWHESYSEFTEDDHEDASRYHFNQWETLYEDLVAKTNSTYHDNNKRLMKYESNWELHEKFKAKIRLEREIAEKEKRKKEKAAIPLTKYELAAKEEMRRVNKEFRDKKKNLSDTDKLKVHNLERALDYMKDYHPQDCLSFGVSVSEQRGEIRAKIRNIINNSTNGTKS